VDGNQSETASTRQTRKASLGESLVAARERRGLTRETVVEQTHIPAHYVQMLEDDDYRRIADQLYLLPFLRKYADFLNIDQEETAMRLLREVQRVDNSPSPVRLDDPLDDSRHHRRRNWTKPIMFSGLVAIIIGAYIAQSHHSDTDTVAAVKPQSTLVPVPSSPVSKLKTSSPPSGDSGTASMTPAASGSLPPTTLGTGIGARGDTQSVTRQVTPPAVRRGERTNLQRRTPGALKVTNH
jgi:cytoskeleton protein RodZ